MSARRVTAAAAREREIESSRECEKEISMRVLLSFYFFCFSLF
jgi:hypothetical protein